MGLFGLFKKKTVAPAPALVPAKAEDPPKKTENHRIAGISFHQKEIMQKFAVENEDYNLSKKEMIAAGLIGVNVFQYDFDAINTELVPEPTNPEDPKAIKVVVDGVHIGYIKKGSCAHVRKLMDSGSIEKIDIVIKGGNCKYIGNESGFDEEPEYTLDKDKRDLSAEIRLTLK